MRKCDVCGRESGDRDTVCRCGSRLGDTDLLRSDDLRRRGLFTPWVGGYSQKRVDEFVNRLSALLVGYEVGSSGRPDFKSSDVPSFRFPLVWTGYKPGDVDEFLAKAVATLRRYEAKADTAGTKLDSEPSASPRLLSEPPVSAPSAPTRQPAPTIAALPAAQSGSGHDMPNSDRVAVIRRFLGNARRDGALDIETHLRLLHILEQESAIPEPKPADPMPPRSVEQVPRVPPRELEPQREIVPRPVAPQELPPRPPRRPNPAVTKLSALWDAIASDIALHGFAYLGVLLTVIGVLGFLLFAFVDVADQAQPFVELFIASIFFGWAWGLRRQGALRVGKAMELVGGIVVPLVLFAGLVDNAPFPPDFEGGALVAALTLSALLVGVAYALISSKYPESMLRYLVAPLLWLAGLSLGFAFKTDEPLRSDAITRLVSHQPAIGAAVIALTLAACRRRPSHRLALPTVRSALVGGPVAYLLAIALTVGEGWMHTGPLVLLGASTFVSAELLALWFEKTEWVAKVRPLLLAGVIAPLVPTMEIGWSGLIVAMAYLAMGEFTLRREPPDPGAILAAASGALVGALLTLTQPWAALIAYSVLTLWAPYQRVRWAASDEIGRAVTAVGGAAPIGVAWAVIRLVGGGGGWMVIAAALILLTIWSRWRRLVGEFWMYWPSGAALAVAAGGVSAWSQSDMTDLLAVGAVAGSAVTVSLGPGRRDLRVWVGSGLSLLALALALETANLTLDERVIIWAGLGLACVVGASLWHRPPAGHIAAIGHLIGLGSLIPLTSGVSGAVAVTVWTVGWAVSMLAAERDGDSLDSLIRRASKGLEGVAPWVAPVMLIASFPVAVVATARLSESFASDRSWSGVALSAVAVGYALCSKLSSSRHPAFATLSVFAMVVSLVGIAVTAPDRWPSIFAATAVIAVAAIVRPRLRPVGFVWVAWVMSFVLAVLLAEQLGVAARSLHLVTLIWGGALLLGGLVLDDMRSGRRQPGEGLRTPWLRFPVALGLIAVPISFSPIFTRPPGEFGWWCLAAAAGYFAVAYLSRVGSVTSVAYGLLTLGIVSLSGDWFLDAPWRLVIIAAPLVLVAWIAARRQSDGSVSSRWLRWDEAPFAVAHLVGGYALIIAMVGGHLSSTGLSFGLLSVAVGLWRKGRSWIDAGNVLVVAAAVDAGAAWPTIALFATAVRGGVGAFFSSGSSRLVNHLIGVASTGLGWLTLIVWIDLGPMDTVNLSAMTWGIFAVAVTGLGRIGLVKPDSLMTWSGLAWVVMLVVSQLAFGTGDLLVDGPWLGIGYLLLAASLELAWPVIGSSFRLLSIPAFGAAWFAFMVGSDWQVETILDVTAFAFGFLVVAAVELRRALPSPAADSVASVHMIRGWAALGAVGVVATVVGSAGAAWPAFGLGLVAVGSARGAQPLAVGWLREASGVLALTSLTLMINAAEWSEFGFAVSLVVASSVATVTALKLWTSRPESAWIRPLGAMWAFATLEALVLVVRVWPARGLLVALLLSVGIQASAVGRISDRLLASAAGPPLLGAGFLFAIWESVSGSVQWYTVPLGLVVLAEVEIFRRLRHRAGPDGLEIVAVEMAGLGLVAAPALVEMFTAGLPFGLVAFGVAAACFIWAILTRVRRRVVAAAAIALVTAVLLIFAAAASQAPGSAFVWVVAVGVGFSVMLVAALVESYRSKKGRLMSRLDQLMTGWE